jgi:uncharacterized protein
MRRDFIYLVKDLSVEGTEIDIPLETDWLRAMIDVPELSPIEGQKGRFWGRLSMTGKEVIVRGHVRAPLQMPCARCLGPASIQVNAELTLVLSPGPSLAQVAKLERLKAAEPESVKSSRGKKAKEANASSPAPKAKAKNGRENSKEGYVFSEGEAESDHYEGEEVALDRFVREAILLEIPIFPLCSEQCPGIGAIPEEPTNT